MINGQDQGQATVHAQAGAEHLSAHFMLERLLQSAGTQASVSLVELDITVQEPRAWVRNGDADPHTPVIHTYANAATFAASALVHDIGFRPRL